MSATMTPRARVRAALTGATPDRIPRTYSAVAGFDMEHPGAMAELERVFPRDADHVRWSAPPGSTQGDPFAIGTYIDEWGCAFENVHPGIVGQVKTPQLQSWSDLAKFRPPMHLVGYNFEAAAQWCAQTDIFTLTPLPVQPFERLQFLRGTEVLFRDLMRQPKELLQLRDMLHEFYLAWIEAWCATPVDCIFLADDWGTQNSLLISPRLWRSFFKPLYAEYIGRAKAAGKFTYMHSDGHILPIIEDLIEIGLDALNAQVTCMDMAELGQRFAGRITFWGQMDRQQMLCFGSVTDAQRDVATFYEHLATPNGSGVVAQTHIEPTARPENLHAVFAAFDRVQLPKQPTH